MIPTSPPLLDQFPLAQQLNEKAAQEEIQTLVQFSFFRTYLAELLDGGAEAKLDVLILKGAALAETVYPRPSLRRFGDMDVLVRASDIARARTVLETLGYETSERQWGDLEQGRDCQANFLKHPERGVVVVELHTQLLNNPLFFGAVRFDESGIWKRSRPVRLANRDARVLGPEDQLLHLCLHLGCHYLAAPNSLRDIDRVCRVCAVDWPLFVTAARRARARAVCFASLFVAHRLLGTDIPADVLDALAPRLGRRLLERLASARAADFTESRTEALRFPLILFLLDTPAARWKALRHTFYPSSSWLITHYYFDLFPDEGDDPPGLPSRRLRSRLLRVHWGGLLGRLARRG